MAGRMNLIIIGTGEYLHWQELALVQPHNTRFAEYVREQWPDARVIGQGPADDWTAAKIRTKLGGWLRSCGEEDDLVLLWSGHGYGQYGKHMLITYDSPSEQQGTMSTENAIATDELAHYLLQCPARRIVILLNTCWSGDGGQQLAEVISDAVADSPSREQTRSMVIISSARREESVDGAFLSAVLDILRRQTPPPGLAPEHRWTESDLSLDPDRLCAAVNVLLKKSDHQADIKTPYGAVGAFFRRANQAAAAPQLPPSTIGRLRREFPGRLSEHGGPWDAAHITAIIAQHGDGGPADEVAYRLRKLALGLAMLGFLERWLGSGAGLANHLPPAWRAVLWPIHRFPHPTERFGFIEQIVLRARDEQIIEFMARVIRDAGDNPCDDRLYSWAKRELKVDDKAVDDALRKLDEGPAQNRLIINFGIAIADDDEVDALPEKVMAWLHGADGSCRTTYELPFEAPHDVAATVASLVRSARNEAGDVTQVDVALPVSLFRVPGRPEAARLQLSRAVNKPVAQFSGVVIRWAKRISDKGARASGLNQGNEIATSGQLYWVERDEYADPQELSDKLASPAKAVVFSFEPDDLDMFDAAAYNSPYVLWLDNGLGDAEQIRSEITVHWQQLPTRLSAAYKTNEPCAVRSAHAIWDDPEWLENVVPDLPEPDHHLTV
jgi:hypothetical protein